PTRCPENPDDGQRLPTIRPSLRAPSSLAIRSRVPQRRWQLVLRMVRLTSTSIPWHFRAAKSAAFLRLFQNPPHSCCLPLLLPGSASCGVAPDLSNPARL